MSRRYLIDFHVHLADNLTQMSLCPDVQETAFFKKCYPLLERIAHVTDPVHDRVLRQMAMNYNGPMSRFIYGAMGQFGLMETLRLFKTFGLIRLLSSMDALGIDHSVIHSLEPITATKNILELTKDHRDRLSVFASVARSEADPVAYLTPFIESGSIKGLKIHPIVGGYGCGEFFHRTKDLIALAVEANIPILIHTGHIPVHNLTGIEGCNEITALEPALEAFPTCKFILAHTGWESWREALKLGQKYPNVFVETSWQPARIIRRSVDTLGPYRVLFGSDFPLFRQSMALDQVRKALSPREFALVTWGNPVRLLKLEEKSALKTHVS